MRGSRGDNRVSHDRSKTTDSGPKECRPEVQESTNVYLGGGILPFPPSPTLQYLAPPTGSPNSSKVGPKERGRSRRRRASPSPQPRAVARSKSPPPPSQANSTAKERSSHVQSEKQHKCTTTSRSPPRAKTDEDNGQLGRGQRRRWAPGSRSKSQTTKRDLDLSRDGGSCVTMEDGGERRAKAPQKQSPSPV